MAKPQQPDAIIQADDFIKSADRNPGNDEGRVPLLEANERIDPVFLNDMDLGDGSDGDVTISSSTTLTRDMYYANLTVNDTLITNGYRIYVSETLSGTGTIKNTGSDGGDGGDASSNSNGGGGTGADSTGSGPFKTGAGANGGGGPSGNNEDGQDGGNTTDGNYGPASPDGGVGGRGTDSSGNAGDGGEEGSKTILVQLSPTALTVLGIGLSPLMAIEGITKRGGNGGGGGSRNNGFSGERAGGGGGGGASGGTIWIACGTFAGTFAIETEGGKGGKGGDGRGSGGAGGGGAGGNGGDLIIFFKVKTWTGTSSLIGGVGGDGGTSPGSAVGGEQPGDDGADGILYEQQIS